MHSASSERADHVSAVPDAAEKQHDLTPPYIKSIAFELLAGKEDSDILVYEHVSVLLCFWV